MKPSRGTIGAEGAAVPAKGRWLAIGLALTAVLLVLDPVPPGRAAETGTATVRVVTEEFPPYDFTDQDGVVQGFATDVVRRVLARLEVDAEIEVFPWPGPSSWPVETPIRCCSRSCEPRSAKPCSTGSAWSARSGRFCFA